MATHLHNGAQNGNGSLGASGATLAAQVAAAQRLANAVVSSFELCQDAGIPLSERQKAAIVTAALLEFDGIESEVSAVLAVEDLLLRLRSAA